jgi:hypothetical protein
MASLEPNSPPQGNSVFSPSGPPNLRRPAGTLRIRGAPSGDRGGRHRGRCPDAAAKPERSSIRAGVEHLKHYLQTERPPHDYGRVLLLWASTKMPDLLDKVRQQELVKMIWKHQQADGGWSIRTFAPPAAWGCGNRAEKLRGEPEFGRPPSDGHGDHRAAGIRRAGG